MSERRPYLQWSGGAAGPALAAEDDADWRDSALCAETDPEAFFPEKGGSTREAKKVCMACEVRAECLEYALEHDERFGIWGGMSERQRRTLTRLRRAQPQEVPAEGEKPCCKCGETKPLSEYYAHPAMPDGRRSDCILCVRKRTAARKQELRQEKAA